MYLRDHWQTYYGRQGRWQIFNMASLQVGYSVLVPPKKEYPLIALVMPGGSESEEEKKKPQ